MEFPKSLKTIQSGNFTFYDTSIEIVRLWTSSCTMLMRVGGFMETYREENFVAGSIDTSLYKDNQSSHPFKVCFPWSSLPD